jgi:beta-galactosidase
MSLAAMPDSIRTAFDPRGVAVGGRTLPFYAGAMHYWRMPVASWAPCLRAIHDLGLTVVETYVPWRVHETAPGRFDWTGHRDLPAFLAAAGAAGLAVTLRPGPHINAEMTSFGMPDWVLADPACQARTASGTPAWLPSPPRAWPIPSYASAAFKDRLRGWLSAFAAVVAPALAPDGPVVALGVDNEAQLFFRLGAFDLDYHPDAIAWWHEATGIAEPPRDASDRAAAVRWVQFKDIYLARSLGEIAAMLGDVGLGGVARFHNLPPGHHGLNDPRRIQSAIGGPVGIDAYTARATFTELRRRAAALVGTAAPVPIAFEVGVGFIPWVPPLDPPGVDHDATRERDQLLHLLAAGIRGFNLYMAVERDRFYGAAIDKHGRIEPHAAWIAPLCAALAEVDWPSLRRTPAPAVAVVACRADYRHGVATSLLDPITPVLTEALDLGPGGAAELGDDAGAVTVRRWQQAVCRALELAQVGYAIVDEAAPAAELAAYRAVIAPTIDRIDALLAGHLRALAEAGTVVVIGPGTPTRDELDRPLAEPLPRRVGRLKPGSLEDLAGLAADLGRLAGAADDTWQVERASFVGPRSAAEQPAASLERGGDVRVAAFAPPGGAVRAVIATNDAARPVAAVVLADGHRLRDVFTGERVAVVDGRATLHMPPRGARMFVVE